MSLLKRCGRARTDVVLWEKLFCPSFLSLIFSYTQSGNSATSTSYRYIYIYYMYIYTSVCFGSSSTMCLRISAVRMKSFLQGKLVQREFSWIFGMNKLFLKSLLWDREHEGRMHSMLKLFVLTKWELGFGGLGNGLFKGNLVKDRTKVWVSCSQVCLWMSQGHP